MNKIFIIAVLSALGLMAFTNNAKAQEYQPQAGDKMISLRLGKAVDYGTLSSYEVNSSLSSSTTSISQPVSAYYLSNSNNSIVNAIGIEAKYFLSSNIALRFSGGGLLTASPSQDLMEGVSNDYDYPGTSIPTYAHLEGKTTYQFYGDLGADYYFNTSVNRLFPFVGIQVNSVYGRMEIYDGYRGVDNNEEVIPTYDTRRGEIYALGGSLVGGIDYYLSEGFFFGIELKCVSYMYNAKRVFHQPGLEAQDADTHVTSFLSQPVIKLGFKF